MKIFTSTFSKLYVLFFIILFVTFQAEDTPVFKDQFTGETIFTEKVSKTVEPNRIDGIIYFEKRGNIYKRVYQKLTPEMFGAKGDGKTDDYAAIQKMLDAGEVGCTFSFSKNRTYYNAFKNDGKWKNPKQRNYWQRSKGANFEFNGAKLRRRIPQWNYQNAKSNLNEGKFYTDEHSAILYLTGDNYTIDGADFSSGIPLGILLDANGKPTQEKNYAVGQGMTMGLWLDNCKNVNITNSTFSNTVFPLYITNSRDLILDKITLKYAAQATARINPGDPATGAGMKLMNTENVTATNIYGYRNANATVEVESLNRNISVQGMSENDYDTSMTIVSSENVKINWYAKNVVHGSGVIILGAQPDGIPSKNISGKLKVEGTVWCGLLVWMSANSNYDISNINLTVETVDNGHAGIFLNNESVKGKKISGINIRQISKKDGWGNGSALKINNAVEGMVETWATQTPSAVTVRGRNANPLQVKLKSDKTVKKTFDIAPNASIRKL